MSDKSTFLAVSNSRFHIVNSKQICQKLTLSNNFVVMGDMKRFYLTLTMPNFINGKTHLPFLALSIITFRDIKMKT